MKTRKQIKTALLALAVAGGLTLLAGLGALGRADLAVSDMLYQQRESSDGQIVLVGIDQRALEEIGPYNQWSRDIFAQALDYLNQSEDCKPAVICLDVLFAGETDPAADARLAESAGRYGNVVAACAAEFGSALVERGDGDYDLNTFSIAAFDQPYQALAEAAGQGHINAMQDGDGILRHHMLRLSLPDGTQVPSLALEAAERYSQARGLGPVRLPPASARGFWYLPFCGVPGDFNQSISVASLLNGEIAPDYFAEKIVLIGPYASGLQDSYMTAIDHAQPMYGVEFQANAIQALLWGSYRREVGNHIQLVLLFTVLLAALAGFWRRTVKWATALWALLCGGWVLLCLGLSSGGWLLHVLWVPAGVTVLYAGCLAFNYIQAALERRKVTGAFKRYVAPEIVNKLLEDDCALALGGVSAKIAVLFVDIRGFTAMSEELEPEQIVGILNRYLTFIAQCILKNGGTLDKFVGDEAMAFWGAPLEHEDCAMAAARAAMDMVEGAQELSEVLMKEFGRTVTYGVGIHLGQAVVGNVGCPQRMDYTAIGDTVNTAARLQGKAPGGTIYISRAMADALGDRVRATPLPEPLELKGKAGGFEALTLDEITSCAAPPDTAGRCGQSCTPRPESFGR